MLSFTEAKKTPLQMLTLTLDDGSTIQLPIGHGEDLVMEERKPDFKKNYAHRLLETGTVFWYYTKLWKTPDRSRIIALSKIMLQHLRAKTINAKYPGEMLRMIIVQKSQLSLKEAHQQMYAGFVNTKGTHDSHVPADLAMEWQVKDDKRQINHLTSNKGSTDLIQNRTAALPTIAAVSKNYDASACTVDRGCGGSKHDAQEDEISMMADLRVVRPFNHVEGRAYDRHKTISKSLKTHLDEALLRKWMKRLMRLAKP